MRIFLLIAATSILCLQMPTYVYCETDSVIGEWKVVSQVPSERELTAIIAKSMGMKNVNPDTVKFDSWPSTLTITENSIGWRAAGESIDSRLMYSYYLGDGKIRLVGIPNGATALKQWTPQYYFFKLKEGKLILTTNKIPGYENRTITYVLKRVK